jgi:hypothetical protein
MCDGENNAIVAQEKPVKSEWTTPVLIVCGTMSDVLHTDGSGGDGTGSLAYVAQS